MTQRTTLFGNVVRDATAVATKGKAMTRIRVATNTAWTDAEGNHRETTEFHNVVAFGELAGTAAVTCTKGVRVYVEGYIRTREFPGSDGVRRSVTEIVARSLRLFDDRRNAVHVAAAGEATA